MTRYVLRCYNLRYCSEYSQIYDCKERERSHKRQYVKRGTSVNKRERVDYIIYFNITTGHLSEF